MPEDVRDDTVTFVNRFKVHASPEEFEQVFARTSAFMAQQDGFLWHTLLRHADDECGYVNIAQWRDAGAFHRAVTAPGFEPHAATLRSLSTSEPNLYTPCLTVSAKTGDR